MFCRTVGPPVVLEFTDIILFKYSPSPAFIHAHIENMKHQHLPYMDILSSNYAKTFIFLYQTPLGGKVVSPVEKLPPGT